ncbi:hypothetical protein BG011_000240 [Mortierella polycephala]|uniref:Uncharacterized protein n=1 Tax=Mortierella polycephala TaxID=41804 RepID=A0A9P6Q791_9FUNG|nr:hypothetical protein BG011_000240 [Mortierella polycephala]
MSQSNGTPLGSPRISQQHDDLESQYRNSHTEQSFLGSEKSISPRLTILDRQIPSRLSSSPTPSPTPQEQWIGSIMTPAGAAMGEYQLRSSPDVRHNRSPRQMRPRSTSKPKHTSTVLNKSGDASGSHSPEGLAQSKDFYVDMLDLVIDTSPRTANRSNSGSLYSEIPSPCTPTPTENPFGPFASSPPSSPRQAHVRPRTASSVSSKKHADSTPRCTNAGVISPRVSREAARRMVQDFPPPPPPRIPPPAIPVDAQELSSGLKAPRRGTSTVTAAGKEAQAVSCLQPESPRGKGRRSRTSSTTSAKNMVIRPPTSPPPVYRAPPQPISQLYSGELSIGHLRNLSQASSGSHLNRPQIPNKSATSLKSSTSSRPPSWHYDNILPEEPTSPTSQARQQSRSRSPKSDLTQPVSTNVDGKVAEGSQDLEGIIAGAIAITATKKQIEIAESRPTSLSSD